MSKDDLALAAFVLSLAVAAWNLLRFWQEGGRVRVTVKPGTFDRNALVTMDTLAAKRSPGDLDKPGGRFNIEVAVIEVENCGRTPVTIRGVGVDLGRTRWWKLERQTVSLPFLKVGQYETKNKIRIEPYDSVEYVVNANHTLWAIKQRSPGAVSVRATAQVAGQRAARSSWRTRWRFAKGTPPRLWLDEPFDLAREIYRYLYKTVPDNATTGVSLVLPEISMSIAEWVEAGNEVSYAGMDRLIKEHLERLSINEPLVTTFWSHDLVTEFGRPEGGPFDASPFRQRRLARAGAASDNPAPSTEEA